MTAVTECDFCKSGNDTPSDLTSVASVLGESSSLAGVDAPPQVFVRPRLPLGLAYHHISDGIFAIFIASLRYVTSLT